MGIFYKIAKGVIYYCTKKPKQYVHVDKPKNLQECRQVQYNNWCKAKGVYNGSYLPNNPNVLVRKGWIETTSSFNKKNKCHNFQRKSTGQIIRHDLENYEQIAHYHWLNGKTSEDNRKKHLTKSILIDMGVFVQSVINVIIWLHWIRIAPKML